MLKKTHVFVVGHVINCFHSILGFKLFLLFSVFKLIVLCLFCKDPVPCFFTLVSPGGFSLCVLE